MRIGIRKKIMGSFLIGAALFVITVGVGLVRMKEYLNIIEDLIKISERVEMEGDLLLYMDRALMPPNDYLITGDIAERDRFDNSIIRIRDIIDKLIEGEQSTGQLEVIKRVQEEAVKFADMAIDILYLEDPVGNRKAAGMMEEMDSLLDNAIEEARGFYRVDRDRVMEIERLAREKLETTTLFFSVALISAFIFLPLLYIYLSKHVVRPVLALREGTAAIGEGNISHRLPVVKSGDEFESLTVAFNSMADSLQEAKKDLDRNIMELYALYNVTKIMNTTFETDILIDKLVMKISKSLDIQRVMIMLLDERKQEFYPASFTNFEEGSLTEVKIKFGVGLYGLVAQTGMARMVKNVDEEISFQTEDWLSADIQSIIAVPFGRKDKIIGILCAFKDRPGMFERHDLELFRTVAEQLAVALDNARLYSETKVMAITDGLTTLYNHRFFKERLEVELERANRYGRKLSLIIMDIDNFKSYNDNHGHQKGDDLLVELSELLRNCIRECDVVCRYGGEEFVIIMPEVGKVAAGTLAERVRKAVSDYPFPYRETQPLKAISLSLGVASSPEDGKVMDILVKKADDAMYRAKSGGRNRVATA